MTPHQIKKVQDSFDRVFTVKETLSESFYSELFRIVPEVSKHFPEDQISKRLTMTDMISYTVRNLHRPEVVEETIVGLARRHATYGARREHFAPMGMALIHALKENLPGGMSDDEADAWLQAYTFISDLMIEAMPAMAGPKSATG